MSLIMIIGKCASTRPRHLRFSMGEPFVNPQNIPVLLGTDVMTGIDDPVSRSKADLESFAKQHGATIVQSENAQKDIVVIADKGILLRCLAYLRVELVRVAALKKRGTHDILRARWLLDSISIGFVLPVEPR
jgi:hypothetical protein